MNTLSTIFSHPLRSKFSLAVKMLCALASVIALVPARGAVRLPSIFSDHMVLQNGSSTTIWGWADPGETVTVSFAGQSQIVTAGADGTWSLNVSEIKTSSTALTLEVKGKANTVQIKDVLVGEVWLCAGQSNMEMQVDGLHGKVDNAAHEIATADYPEIRMYVFSENYDIVKMFVPPDAPLLDRAGAWIVCSPATVAHFSAVGYFFGRSLHRQLGVPVGLIQAAVGGTPIEAWTSLAAQNEVPALGPVLTSWSKRLEHYDLKEKLEGSTAAKNQWTKEKSEAQASGRPVPKSPPAFRNDLVSKPGGLYNGLIAPILPYTLCGVIWYQGEKNAVGPLSKYYGQQLETLIKDWRSRWKADLYFAWVQIARFGKEQTAPSEANGWGVTVREEMRKTLVVPKTGMAIVIDTGGVTAGHPTAKAPVGDRLALLALHDVYGKASVEWSGPLFRSSESKDGKIKLTFDHATGLKPSSGELRGFAIAGADQKFVWAQAKVDHDNVIVWNDQVTEPVAVRYGWSGNPTCNLVNGAELPASPFKTDDWK